MEDFDPFSNDKDYLGIHHGSEMQMHGLPRTPECKSRLYLMTRIRMLMRLRGCTVEDAVEYIKWREKRKDMVNIHGKVQNGAPNILV